MGRVSMASRDDPGRSVAGKRLYVIVSLAGRSGADAFDQLSQTVQLGTLDRTIGAACVTEMIFWHISEHHRRGSPPPCSSLPRIDNI